METAALRYPQAATFTLVQSVNLARMVDLKKSYEERRTYWSDSILPTELKTKLADDVLLKGDRFWTVLNGETVDALQLSDPSRIEAALGSLKDAFHRHEAAVTGLVGSSDTFLKSRERDAETTGAKLTSAAMVGSATSVLLFVGGSCFFAAGSQARANDNQSIHRFCAQANGLDELSAPPSLKGGNVKIVHKVCRRNFVFFGTFSL